MSKKDEKEFKKHTDRIQTREKNKYGINVNRAKFCEVYIENGFNATQAYIEVYGECKTANRASHDLLKQPDIQRYLSILYNRIDKQHIASAEDVLRRTTHFAFSDDVQPRDALKALDLLMKFHKLYENKNEVTHNQVVIVDDITATSIKKSISKNTSKMLESPQNVVTDDLDNVIDITDDIGVNDNE